MYREVVEREVEVRECGREHRDLRQLVEEQRLKGEHLPAGEQAVEHRHLHWRHLPEIGRRLCVRVAQ